MSSNKRIRSLVTIGSALFIIIGTIIAIQFAKGYRPSRQGFVAGTGLLAANSLPEGSLITIDGQTLDTLTNETVTLDPGSYQVKISKVGYTNWEKTLQIEPEVVTSTNALLFRTVPSLTPLTFSGATNLNPSPDGQKITFVNATSSAQLKQGLYLLELSNNPLSFSKTPKQIAQNPPGTDFKDANILWSPDSSQILASFNNANYLLEADTLTKTTQLTDISPQLSLILKSWEQEITQREKQLLLGLPDEMLKIATSSAKNLYFSPNSEKLLYTATDTITIPPNLAKPPPGSNTQKESRSLEPGGIYVYDIKEDKNFQVLRTPAELPESNFEKIKLVSDFSQSSLFALPSATASAQTLLQDPSSFANTIKNFHTQYSSYYFTNYQWFPTSNHILINQNGSISIIEYDGTNQVNLFAGDHQENFVYPWPDGTKLIILTNLTNSPNLPPNLYSINLK